MKVSPTRATEAPAPCSERPRPGYDKPDSVGLLAGAQSQARGALVTGALLSLAEVSLLERLMLQNSLYQKGAKSYNPQFVTKLLRNYRCRIRPPGTDVVACGRRGGCQSRAASGKGFPPPFCWLSLGCSCLSICLIPTCLAWGSFNRHPRARDLGRSNLDSWVLPSLPGSPAMATLCPEQRFLGPLLLLVSGEGASRLLQCRRV